MNRDNGTSFRRLSAAGVPPSASIARSIGTRKVVNNEPKKAVAAGSSMDMDSEPSEELTDDGSARNATSEAPDEEVKMETGEATIKKRRRRRKKRIRLTDQGLKAKRKAERREKMIAEKKIKEDDSQERELDDEAEANFSTCEDKNCIEEEEKLPEEKILPHTFSAFQLLCDNILRKMMLKDPEGYFALPVETTQAPDYCKVVVHPMDFSTIRGKIEKDLYSNLDELRGDLELISNNAKLYNSPNSLYFLAAQKLAALTKYYLSEKYITYLIYSLPFGKLVQAEKLCLPKTTNPLKQNKSTISGNREKMMQYVKDSMSAKELLANAPTAVTNRLTNRRPKAKMAYLDNRNGAIALNLLTPSQADEATNLRIGDCLKNLEKGNPGICTPFEPRISQDVLVTYTDPGPFASFAPHYQSTWATLSKRDTDLLLSCYGDRNNTADATAMRQMVENCGDWAMTFVDDFLDELTDGHHSNTVNLPESKSPEKVEDENGELLQRTGKKIQELNLMQYRRLSKPPPVNSSHLAQAHPEETEFGVEIAQDLGQQIIEMGAKPGDLVSDHTLRQALGLDDDDDLKILSEFLEL